MRNCWTGCNERRTVAGRRRYQTQIRAAIPAESTWSGSRSRHRPPAAVVTSLGPGLIVINRAARHFTPAGASPAAADAAGPY